MASRSQSSQLGQLMPEGHTLARNLETGVGSTEESSDNCCHRRRNIEGRDNATALHQRRNELVSIVLAPVVGGEVTEGVGDGLRIWNDRQRLRRKMQTHRRKWRQPRESEETEKKQSDRHREPRGKIARLADQTLTGLG